jgi:diguanylate cyclase (GGDEF)-like protein
MNVSTGQIELQDYILDRLNCGIIVVDQNYSIVLWNKYLESHSRLQFKDLQNKNLFECIPNLPVNWLSRKIESVYTFKNFSFTSWKERPYLIPLPHHHTKSVEIDFMRQDCTFIPILVNKSDVKYVCIMLVDVTETCIYQSELTKSVSQLKTLSRIDGLTGLLNRRMVDEKLHDEFKRSKRYDSAFSFAIIDLDHFKNINDTYGHSGGDEVLREVSKTLSHSFRETDIVGRFGGEEFAVIMPNTNLDHAQATLERCRHQIEKLCIQHNDQSISVTASIGYSIFRETVDTFEIIVKEADDALYQSKENGRNKTTLFQQ